MARTKTSKYSTKKKAKRKSVNKVKGKKPPKFKKQMDNIFSKLSDGDHMSMGEELLLNEIESEEMRRSEPDWSPEDEY